MSAKGDANRSVRFTKQRIKEAFIRLMHKQPYASITVSQLAEEANISRSTFYNYYLDIYDLLEKIEAELIDPIREIMEHIELTNYIEGEHPYVSQMYESLLDKQEIIRLLMGPNGDPGFLEKVQELLYQSGYDHFEQDVKIPENFPLVVAYVVAGIIGMFQILQRKDIPAEPTHMGYVAGEYMAFSRTLLGMEPRKL